MREKVTSALLQMADVTRMPFLVMEVQKDSVVMEVDTTPHE